MNHSTYTKMRAMNSPETGVESSSERNKEAPHHLDQALQIQHDAQSKLDGLASKMFNDVGIKMEVPNIREQVQKTAQKTIAPRYEELLHTILP